MSKLIQLRKNVPSGTIVISRPKKRNALNRQLIAELLSAFEDFQGERAVRAVILTGTDKAFCSGTDLSEITDDSENPQKLQTWQEEMQELQTLLETMLRFPKPIIAAVNGCVAGSGVALMLSCDLVIASESANLSLPEVSRGLVPGASGPLLVFRAGASTAAHLLLTSESFGAEDLLRMNLINEVVSDDLVWARAHQRAVQIADTAPSAQMLTKQLINETIGESLLVQLSIGLANSAAARSTESAQHGIESFLAKKTAKWD